MDPPLGTMTPAQSPLVAPGRRDSAKIACPVQFTCWLQAEFVTSHQLSHSLLPL